MKQSNVFSRVKAARFHMLITLTLAFFAIMSGVSLAQTALNLVNPGFETKGGGNAFGNNKIGGGFDVGGVGGTTDCDGWLNSGATYVDSGIDYNGNAGWTTHSGNNASYCDGVDSGAYQIVAGYQMNAGDQLTLTWWGRANGAGAQQNIQLLRAAATNTAFASLVQVTNTTAALNATGNGGAYTQYTLTYTAVAADVGNFVAVAFKNPSGAGNWTSFDDFSLSVIQAGQPVSLVNPGFEVGMVAKISTGFSTVPGWADAGAVPADSGVQDNKSSGGINTTPWSAYLQTSAGSGAYQISGYQIQLGDVITLAWQGLGQNGSSNGTAPGDPAQMVHLFSAVATNTAYASTTILASKTNGLPSRLSAGGPGWTAYTLTYAATAADVGKYVGVHFVSALNSGPGGGVYAEFDNFSLSVLTTVVSAPVVMNYPATAIQAASAALNGKIVSTGGSTSKVTIYYGTNDGGMNTLAWSNSIALGAQPGTFTATASGLKTNTTYYFTAWATNDTGASWASPSKSFTTLTLSAPTVTNLPATSVAAVFATLNGQVLNTGNEWPTVRIYYGTNDGGANPSAWTNQISLGAQTNIFSAQVAGLVANTTYYFTTSVSNSAGVAWGGASKSFNTLPLTRVPVLTFHYDNTRQGQNTNETVLTPSNVNVTNFGKLFSYPVDSYVYAQPLIVNDLNIPGKGVRNVVFVSTMHNSVYAFDADSNADANGGLLWQQSLGTAAISPSKEYGARYHSQGNTDVTPEEGAMGTPVIDPVSGTIYLDAFTREVVAGISTNYFHRIHALNITNGNEQPYSPVTVAASVPGRGVGGNGSTVSFSAIQHMARPALTLAGGILYVCYGSHADTDPYHGWIMGFNPTNLAFLSGQVFNTTPNANSSSFPNNPGEGGLWMGGNGLCVDANTNLYFEVANGSFSANTNGGDYGDSFVRLSTASGLSVADYFTPFNQASLQTGDTDLGSGGPILLPDSAGNAQHPHLLVGAGKEGKIYLVDRDNMGKFNTGSDTNLQVISGAIGGGGSFAVPAYFNKRIYYTGKTDKVKAWFINNAAITTTPESQTIASIGPFTGSPIVTANGTNNAIVWVTDPGAYNSSGPAVLHAYNATNLAIELYNSSMNLSRDNPGGAVKMTAPTETGGKVYVGAEYALSVYGPAIFLAAPTISPNGGTFTNSATISITDTTAGVAIYYTLDGTTPTTSSTLYTGAFNLTSNALVQALAVAPGAVNSAVTSAAFINTAASGNGIGLYASYYTNHTSVSPFTGAPVLVQTNGTINFNWGTTGPNQVVGTTNFTVRWQGSVQPQFSETYNFVTTADDGVRLYVNGQLLIDDWLDKASATSKTNSIALVAQQLYNLQLDYYQKANNASVALAWSSPSTPLAILPQTQLYPFTNPPPAVAILSPSGSATNFTAAATVTISADADTAYNPISMVNFYANSTFLGSATTLPYTITTTGLAAGNYALTAVAVDGSGLSSTSAPVNITVKTASGQPYGLTSIGIVPPFFRMPTTFNGTLPTTLSQVGIFSNTASMALTNGFIPYTPNTPLWSDNAIKTRFVAVPNNGGLITPGEQIAFAPTGTWTFPAGTIFVKTFELNTDTTNPNVKRRLETRLLVRDSNGAVYGVTYKWRADNSDADLLAGSLTENILITNATGTTTQTWYYPSPADCLTCHTPVANYVLGLSTRQLNGNQTYPATGVTDNQLRTLNRLGLLNPAFDEASITNMEKLSALTNLTASLQERARSYLDANCAHCHQPNGPVTHANFDARYDTPLANQNITNAVAQSSLGYDNAKIIAPHDVWRSMMWQRMNTTNDTYKMPPLARALIDTSAVQVFTDWINSLPGTPALAPPTITPNGGSFIASASVTIASPDTNATIFYTLDGSLPTTNSFTYSGTFTLFTNATVSANAFAAGFNNSVAANALFAVQPLYFASSGFLTNGQFQLGFVGVPGSNYVLLATTNFTSWTPISTNLAVTNFLNLLDSKATNFPFRFYRVQQP